MLKASQLIHLNRNTPRFVEVWTRVEPFAKLQFNTRNHDRDVIPCYRFVHNQSRHNKQKLIATHMVPKLRAMRDNEANTTVSIQDTSETTGTRIALAATPIPAPLALCFIA